MVKRTDTSTYDWFIYDTARDTYNVASNYLRPNLSNAEDTNGSVDFLSNGFKLRAGATNYNGNGYTYIYAAFAENPTKFANARWYMPVAIYTISNKLNGKQYVGITNDIIISPI